MPFRYYYSTMTHGEQAVYIPLAEGLAAFATSIRVPRLTVSALSDVLYRLRLDDPRLCFVRDISFRSYRDADHVEVIPDYAFPPARMRTVLVQIDTRVKKLTAPMLALKTQVEKEQAVHDWLVDSVRYDKLTKNYAHEVIGPLCHGIGVCEGIAKTAKLFFDALGMESVVVVSEPEVWEDGAEGYRHAWNLVRLKNTWYHMDATFDNSLTVCGRRRYDEFNLSDADAALNHRPSLYPLPPCPRTASWYAAQKCAPATEEELADYLRRTGRRGTAVFLFQWSGEGFPRERIAEVCASFAEGKEKTARLQFHTARKVALLTLKDPAEDPGGMNELDPD